MFQLPTITYHSLWLITLGKSNLNGFLYLSINVFTRNLLAFFAIYSRLSETCTRSWYDQFVKRGKKCGDGVIAYHLVSGWTRWAGWAEIYDLSIGSTETKYIKLDTKIQNIFCCVNQNLTTFLYTLTRKQRRKKVFSLMCIQKSNVIAKKKKEKKKF